MIIQNLSEIYRAKLSDSDFERLGSLIYRLSGIKMPASKKVMAEARIKKRLKALNMTSFSEYVNFVFSPKGSGTEILHVLDVISTNKTDFFREPFHFNYLTDVVLSDYLKKNSSLQYKIWSAGCSSGEEVYTLAIVLSEFSQKNREFDFSIFGTDISTAILDLATKGVYAESRLHPGVNQALIRKYFMMCKDQALKTCRVVPEIRQKTRFARLNFMDDNYCIAEKFDAIFCRNVLIYFDRSTQEKVVQKLCNYLKPGGYLFHGHSESLIGMDLPLKNIKPTIFQKI